MSFLSNLFKKKPGGTKLGNFLRSGVKAIAPFASGKIDQISGLIPAPDAETTALLTDVKTQNDQFQQQLDKLVETPSTSATGNAITNTINWFKQRIEEFTGGLKSTGDGLNKASDSADNSTNKLVIFGCIILLSFFLFFKPKHR